MGSSGSRLPARSIVFAEKVLKLLDEGRRTATYKCAVLLALMDISLERTQASRTAPDVVTTPELAGKIVEIYASPRRVASPFQDPRGARRVCGDEHAGRGFCQSSRRLTATIRPPIAVSLWTFYPPSPCLDHAGVGIAQASGRPQFAEKMRQRWSDRVLQVAQL
jgi:hypothetical protein